ncbi:MAG: hypothetical protein R2940_14965 [Syntrophotaleaceae bacterium]
MKLPAGIGDQPIKKMIEKHPFIGEVLQKYDIGCITCGVGICLVKDVVSIHAFGEETEAKIEREIMDYLQNREVVAGAGRKG